jgi:hypothetical protein
MASVNDYPLPPGRAFEIPGQDISVQQARYQFFCAVHRVNPRVTDELMSEPLDFLRPLALLEPSLATLAPEMPPPQQVGGRYLIPARGALIPYWEVFKYATERNPEGFRQLRDRLRQWADRWRLWPANPDDDWCLAFATDAIVRAVGDDAYRADPFRYARFIVEMLSDEEVQFAFTQPEAWQPTFEGWAEAERRLDDAYRRAKQTYKERIERACREEGMLPVRSSRRRKGNPFEWLARYQTRGERWAWIAEEETKRLALLGDQDGVTDKAVAKAASGKADFIGLKLVDSSRGRPRKQPNSEPRNRT